MSAYTGSTPVIITNTSEIHPIPSIPSNPGLFVCCPTCTSAGNITMQNLGDGMAHWLQFFVAGMPYFSRSQFWSDQKRIGIELHHSQLHLTSADLPELSRASGVTDAVVLSIKEVQNGFEFIATTYSLPHCQPIGVPIAIAGSPSVLCRNLPILARAVAIELGAKSLSGLPKTTDLNCNEMEFLGSISLQFDPVHHINDKVSAELLSLSNKTPLAAAMALGNTVHPVPAIYMYLPKKLRQLTPINTQGISILTNMGDREIVGNNNLVEKSLAVWPQNYILAMSKAQFMNILHSTVKHSAIVVKAFTEAELDDPANPQAWASLSDEIENIADNLRQGKFARDITSNEWSQLDKLYSIGQFDAKKAVSLDKLDYQALDDLAVADTFNGDTYDAERALQTEQRIAPQLSQSYNWGLQLYQHKWTSGSANLLVDDARNYAAACDYYSGAWKAVNALNEDDMKPEAQILGNTIIRVNAGRVARDPGNSKYEYHYAGVLLVSGKTYSAYRIFYKLASDPVYGYFAEDSVAVNEFNAHRFVSALPDLKIALELGPDDHSLYDLLGFDLRACGHPHQGIALIKARLKEDPYDWDAEQNLGNYLILHDHPHRAIPLLVDSLKRYPWQNSWGNLASAYLDLHQYQKTIEIAKIAIPHLPNDTQPYDILGACYMEMKQYKQAEKYYEKAIQINSTDVLAIANAGNLYRRTGDIKKAREYWKKCLTLSNNPLFVNNAKHFEVS